VEGISITVISKSEATNSYAKYMAKGFIQFRPKTPHCEESLMHARVSITLKDLTANRANHLWKILPVALLCPAILESIVYSKIETHAVRTDAILLDLCVQNADSLWSKINALNTCITNKEKLLSDQIGSVQSIFKDGDAGVTKGRNGPYFQQWHGRYFVADYTKGTSWGTDVCCLWAQIAKRSPEWEAEFSCAVQNRRNGLPSLIEVVHTQNNCKGRAVEGCCDLSDEYLKGKQGRFRECFP